MKQHVYRGGPPGPRCGDVRLLLRGWQLFMGRGGSAPGADPAHKGSFRQNGGAALGRGFLQEPLAPGREMSDAF